MTTPRQIPAEINRDVTDRKAAGPLPLVERNSYGNLPGEPVADRASTTTRTHQPYPRRYGSAKG
jgi:hypothetical protein